MARTRISTRPFTAICGAFGCAVRIRSASGKELSYNNIADADAAWEQVKTFVSRPV